MLKLKNKYFYNFENFFLCLFLIILFFPKLDLIEIRGYWQGIRLEDIALVIYGLVILTNYDEKIINNEKIKKFSPLLIYFILIFFGSFIGKLTGNKIEFFSLIRLLEYSVIVLLVCNLDVSKEDIVKFLKFYLIANLLMILLQKLDIAGSFTSLGYLDPSHPQNTRYIGLTGGSWEIGVIFSICYFIIVKIEKPKPLILLIYFLVTLFINIIAENRMNAIGFLVANIFFLKHHLSFLKYLTLIFISFTFIVISPLLLENLGSNSIDRLMTTKYKDALLLMKEFFLFLEMPLRDDIDRSLWSLWYRLSLWSKLIIPYMENFYTIIFGSGLYAIYYESTILRIIFTTGLLGLIYVIYNLRKMEIYLVIYFILTGITLDIFNSIKIFSFTILYFRFLHENYSYRRN